MRTCRYKTGGPSLGCLAVQRSCAPRPPPPAPRPARALPAPAPPPPSLATALPTQYLQLPRILAWPSLALCPEGTFSYFFT